MQLPLTKTAQRKLTEITLSLVSIVYICYALVWISPESQVRSTVIAPLRLPWEFFGLNQHWAMFSPTVRDTNLHTSATIAFRDGTVLVWEPPRMERLSLWDRFRLEKFRKWDIDWLPWTKYRPFYPDLARYVGRQYYSESNQPVSFSLHLHSTKIPRIQERFCERTKLPPHTDYNTLFTYLYSDKDFK